jgi:hypothetical protein
MEVALYFSGAEVLSDSARARICAALRRDENEHIRKTDTVRSTEPGAGMPYRHEQQARDHCASHAINSMLGYQLVTGRDIESAKAKRAARDVAGMDTLGGLGINFFEVQEIMADKRGEELRVLSFVMAPSDGSPHPYTSAADWVDANTDTMKALLGAPRFLINAPGHFMAVHRSVLDGTDPFVLVDSCVQWQSVLPPVRLVEHIITSECVRATANRGTSFSSAFALVRSDPRVNVLDSWVRGVMMRNADVIARMLDILQRNFTIAHSATTVT